VGTTLNRSVALGKIAGNAPPFVQFEQSVDRNDYELFAGFSQLGTGCMLSFHEDYWLAKGSSQNIYNLEGPYYIALAQWIEQIPRRSETKSSKWGRISDTARFRFRLSWSQSRASHYDIK